MKGRDQKAPKHTSDSKLSPTLSRFEGQLDASQMLLGIEERRPQLLESSRRVPIPQIFHEVLPTGISSI